MDISKINDWIIHREHEVILIALCIVAVSFSFLNPLWYSQAPGFDASTFAVIGKMWANGEVLYRDMVDIKGPGIFWIDMIGYRIGGYPGIAFIETLFLVFGVISVDLALRTFKFSPLSRFCSIIVVMSILALRYYYGNMTEDYALYLAMIASYPFSVLFGKRRFRWGLSVVPALAFAFTLSVRINNGAYFLAWYIMLFLFYAQNGNIKDSFRLLGSALLGFLVVWGGFAYYFYLVGGVELINEALYYSVLIFLQDGGAYGVHNLNFLTGLVGFFRVGLFAVIIGFAILLNSKDNNLIVNAKYNDRFWFMLYLVFGIVLTLVANSLSGHIYDHYDQLYLPFMFIPLAFLMHRYLHVKQDIHISFLTIVFLLVFLVAEHIIWKWNHHEWTMIKVLYHLSVDMIIATLVSVVLYVVRQRIGIFRHNHSFFLIMSISISLMLSISAILTGSQNGTPWDESTAEKVKIINEDTGLTDKIWVEGDMPQFYLWTDRTAASPYLFSSSVYPGFDVKQKVIDGIAYFKPKYVVIREKFVDEFIKSEAERMAEMRYSRSEQAFYKYIFQHYTEVTKGLYKLRVEEDEAVEDSGTEPTLTEASANKEEAKHIAPKADAVLDERVLLPHDDNNSSASTQAPTDTNKIESVLDAKAGETTDSTSTTTTANSAHSKEASTVEQLALTEESSPTTENTVPVVASADNVQPIENTIQPSQADVQNNEQSNSEKSEDTPIVEELKLN